MKTLKYLVYIGFIVFMTCSPALSVVDVYQYFNADTVNQAAIEAAIAGGEDPISLAADLAIANPNLAAEFLTAVVKAAPNVDIVALTEAVVSVAPDHAAAITAAAIKVAPPDMVDAVTTAAIKAASPDQAAAITKAAFTVHTTQLQEYQLRKIKNVPSPSS